MRLDDKVALVTGAGRGIGEAIAVRLAQEGADIIVCDIDVNSARETAEKIKRIGRRSLVTKSDVSKIADIEKMVNLTLEKFGKIDILVNNAGIVIVGSVTEYREEDWDKTINVNLKGVFLCCKVVAKVMIKQKSGKIINIASDSGKTGSALFVPYNASKFGVVGFTQGLAKELAPHKINVNAVCPGVVETKMWDCVDEKLRRMWGLSKVEALKMHIKRIPLGRLEKPKDVAGVVAFLTSKDADYMTGQAINVTGGREMH